MVARGMNNAPDTWIFGDLQGCCNSLHKLLAAPEIAANPQARFWFAGDLVNRGPDSLGTLRTVMALGDRAVSILGNHDLHLLGVVAGVRKPGKSDTIKDVLNAPDSQQLIDWLRHRPLAHFAHGHLMVHAGVLPQWSVAQTLSLAAEVETALRGPDWMAALETMFGNEPACWDDGYTNGTRLRVIINALTRMRMCTSTGRMEFAHKGAPEHTEELMAWFDVPGRATRQDTIVFGHWSTLGLMMRPDVICLDTGCVWGRKLTALRLQDHKLVQVQCLDNKPPAAHQAA